MPFVRITRISSAVISGLIILAISRVKCEGVAASKILALRIISSRSVVHQVSQGVEYPAKKSCLRDPC